MTDPTSCYRSFSAQTHHYFNRWHSGVPTTELIGPSVWRGADLRAAPERWVARLNPSAVEEIHATASRLLDEGYTLTEVNRLNFQLPTVAGQIDAWRHQIVDGLGFLVVKGLPVEDWDESLVEMAFWGIGHHLGLPGAQNPDQELLGHVTDYQESDDDPNVRLYRTAANIDFHCDAADVVGLLCVQPAISGGQSRIVSTGTLFNEALRQAPQLVEELFKPFRLDGRGEHRPGSPPFSELAPCAFADGVLRTFYHSEYMRSVERHPGVVLSDAQRQLLDLYDESAADPAVHLDMWLAPGDVQFISNHTIAHARTAYSDDPDHPRHLLRLWLSLE